MLSFEEIPNAIADISNRLGRIEEMLSVGYCQPKTQTDILNIHDASKLLNLKVSTVYSMVSRKQIPFSKRSKKLYFNRIELLDFVREGRVLTNEEVKQNAVSNAALAMTKGGC